MPWSQSYELDGFRRAYLSRRILGPTLCAMQIRGVFIHRVRCTRRHKSRQKQYLDRFRENTKSGDPALDGTELKGTGRCCLAGTRVKCEEMKSLETPREERSASREEDIQPETRQSCS